MLEQQLRAVAVAKDVLAHLDALQLTTAAYLAFDGNKVSLPEQGNLQDYLPDVAPNCRVCAVGALLVSKVRLFDQVDIGQLNLRSVGVLSHDDGCGLFENEWFLTTGETAALADVFDEEQLGLIEAAFMLDATANIADRVSADLQFSDDDEDWDDLTPNPELEAWEERLRAAVEFGEEFSDRKDRLRAIMQNVVKNGGLFVPEAVAAAS